MIIKGDKAETFHARLPPDIFVFLLFGEDEGIVADQAIRVIKSLVSDCGADAPATRLHEDELKREPGKLSELITARPLLGGREIYRLRISNEGLSKQFDSLLQGISSKTFYAENYLIIEAGDLQKKSKIRELFNASQSSAALQFSADNSDQTIAHIKANLASYDITIDNDALDAFASELPGDRRLANSEIEKLSLYAFQLNRSVNIDDIRAIAATEQPLGADDAADAAILGRTKTAMLAIDRFLDAGGSPVSALRTLHFRILRVADAKSGARFLRPSVPSKDQAAFKANLAHWNSRRITRALTMLYSAEKTCKQGGAPAEAALKIVLDHIAKRPA